MRRVLRVGHLLVLDNRRVSCGRSTDSICTVSSRTAGVVTGERDAYQYLGASIRNSPAATPCVSCWARFLDCAADDDRLSGSGTICARGAGRARVTSLAARWGWSRCSDERDGVRAASANRRSTPGRFQRREIRCR